MVATVESPPKPKTTNPLEKLRALAGKTSAPKKSETPIAEAQDLGPVMEQYLEAKRQAEYYESLMETLGAQIRAEAKPRWLEACRRQNKVQSSVKLRATIDGKPQTLTVTQQARYCAIKTETEPQQQRLAELQAAFPNDHERYFANVIDVKLTDAAAADPQFLGGFVDLLMQHYGEEGFSRYFTVTSTFTPTKAFHEAYVLNPQVQAIAEPWLEDESVRPYKATVKL
jgi:hypothetical protein